MTGGVDLMFSLTPGSAETTILDLKEVLISGYFWREMSLERSVDRTAASRIKRNYRSLISNDFQSIKPYRIV